MIVIIVALVVQNVPQDSFASTVFVNSAVLSVKSHVTAPAWIQSLILITAEHAVKSVPVALLV